MNEAYFIPADWWAKVDVGDPTECWHWTQSSGSHGYGQTWDGETVVLAHRVAWLLANGPIPDGMTIDHMCRNRTCCNPSHLRLLSNQDNGAWNGNAVKTHCKRGHRFDESNTRIDRHGHRYCRACNVKPPSPSQRRYVACLAAGVTPRRHRRVESSLADRGLVTATGDTVELTAEGIMFVLEMVESAAETIPRK